MILVDTAGIREARGKVEAEGISRALARVEDADLVLWLVDATAPVWDSPPDIASRNRAAMSGVRAIFASVNKIDLARVQGGPERIEISAKTGEGHRPPDRGAAGEGGRAWPRPSAASPLMTRARHRAELEAAHAALQRFGDPRSSPELKAEELRIAARHLGRLTGRIDVEEVLGAIFAEFCIGK